MSYRLYATILAAVALVGTLPFWGKPVGGYLAARFLTRHASPPNEIVLWQPWGGVSKEHLEEVLRRFEAAHPGVKVRSVFTSNSLSANQKLFTGIAANKAPDVTFVDGPQVSEWAVLGALQPLDGRITGAGIKPTDYFDPCWQQCRYDGKVWALTYCADPNFGFGWNRATFRKAGLDPDTPPETIAELDRLSDRLTTRRKDGSLTSIGVIPWGQFGNANSLFTWGWAFGGSFYDPVHKKITANDPKIVKALEWMVSYGTEYDVTKISGLQAGFGSLEQDPFYIGQVAMQCMLKTQVDEIQRVAPHLDYGIGYLPSPPGGEKHSAWVGGWCLALPRGSRHPELGWELMRWLCADAEGTRVVGEVQQAFPGYRISPYFREVKDNPRYRRFFEIIQQCRHQRPVMPAQAYYMGALDRAVSLALYGKKTPRQALDDATRETQQELDFTLAGEK